MRFGLQALPGPMATDARFRAAGAKWRERDCIKVSITPALARAHRLAGLEAGLPVMCRKSPVMALRLRGETTSRPADG